MSIHHQTQYETAVNGALKHIAALRERLESVRYLARAWGTLNAHDPQIRAMASEIEAEIDKPLADETP